MSKDPDNQKAGMELHEVALRQADDGQLQDLIARLEKASGPSRELDAAIMVAVDARPEWARKAKEPLVRKGADVTLGKGGTHFVVAPYTASIDAALTLVPEGWAWFVQHIGFLPKNPEYSSYGDARLWIPSQRAKGLKVENIDARGAANPAIALCIAALKARAALSEKGGAS